MIEILGYGSGTAADEDMYLNFTVPANTQLLLGLLAVKPIAGGDVDWGGTWVMRKNTSPTVSFTQLFSRSYAANMPGVCAFGWENPPAGTYEFRGGLWYQDIQYVTLGLIAIRILDQHISLNGVDGVRAASHAAGATGTSFEIDLSAQPGSDDAIMVCARNGSGAITLGSNQTEIINQLASGSTFRMLATQQRLKVDATPAASWLTSANYTRAAVMLAGKRPGDQIMIL